MELIMKLLIFAISIFILYVVIETAVRQGINSSVIGKYVEQKNSQVIKAAKNDLDD
ncbi:hypothetical protein ACTWP4_04630 [Gracilibacillus sp. D59]|uniref:hypothetical protein n=1 Tax=Gracilibacillus sp. D59 TaxID=3457434 RepID=UPI003FCDE1CD